MSVELWVGASICVEELVGRDETEIAVCGALFEFVNNARATGFLNATRGLVGGVGCSSGWGRRIIPESIEVLVGECVRTGFWGVGGVPGGKWESFMSKSARFCSASVRMGGLLGVRGVLRGVSTVGGTKKGV